MKNIVAIGTGYILIVIQSVIGGVAGKEFFSPSLVLPFILYLGAIDFGSARGVFVSFILGYVLDIFSNAPAGVHTFVLPAVYLVFRSIFAHIMFSGGVFQILITFIASILSGLTILGIRALLQRNVYIATAIHTTILACSVPTAIVSPLVFWVGKIIIPESPKQKEERIIF